MGLYHIIPIWTQILNSQFLEDSWDTVLFFFHFQRKENRAHHPSHVFTVFATQPAEMQLWGNTWCKVPGSSLQCSILKYKKGNKALCKTSENEPSGSGLSGVRVVISLFSSSQSGRQFSPCYTPFCCRSCDTSHSSVCLQTRSVAVAPVLEALPILDNI